MPFSPSPCPPAGTGARRGSRIVFPGSPGNEGIPSPPKGARGDAEPRGRKAEEGCPGRGWVRSNEDSSVTRGALFLSRWSAEERPTELPGLRGRPSPPPRPPHGPAEAAGPGRTGGLTPGLEGPPRPPRTRFPWGQRELPHPAPAASLGESLTSPGLSVCLSVRLLRGRTVEPSPAAPCPPPHATAGFHSGSIWEGASSRAALPKGPGVSSCRGITAGNEGPDGSSWAQEKPFRLVHPVGGSAPRGAGPPQPGGAGRRGRRRPGCL